ncbi:MAG: flagellar M-ring protein FliF [SAR324 cluster bacterium]|nr:flagellar M-ring protein FliF [SAR324 cluster bacterium]
MAEASAIQDIRLQFQNFFGNLSVGKRITLLAVLGVILAGMTTLIVLTSRDTWAPVYTNLEPEDAAVIVEKLQENQIPYLLAPGGRTVMVPPNMRDQARLILAKEKVLPGSGVGFLDLFGKPELGETEFQQNVKFRAAQEGELARLITRIGDIRSAKVSLALPKKSVFSDTQEKATAAVSLETSESLSKGQIDTVIHLVASAVEGLDTRFVRVTDQNGSLLSKGFSEDSLSGAMNENYSYKRRFEGELETKILSQLEPVVGNERVEVRVFADIEFDRKTIREELVDPDQVVVISEQSINENSTGSRSIPVGPAGVSSNLPEATGREAATVSDFGKQHTTRNSEVSRQSIVKEPAAGRINRISVSVLLDDKHPAIFDADGNFQGRDNVPWSTEQKDQISDLVKAAIGYQNNETRQDIVTVVNLGFGKPVEEDLQSQIEENERLRDFILNVVRYVALGVAILALILLVIRPMVQRLSAKPADLDLLMGLPATIGELEGEELEIPTEREAGIPPRDKIVDIARQDPLKTASMVRAWLKEKK